MDQLSALPSELLVSIARFAAQNEPSLPRPRVSPFETEYGPPPTPSPAHHKLALVSKAWNRVVKPLLFQRAAIDVEAGWTRAVDRANFLLASSARVHVRHLFFRGDGCDSLQNLFVDLAIELDASLKTLEVRQVRVDGAELIHFSKIGLQRLFAEAVARPTAQLRDPYSQINSDVIERVYSSHFARGGRYASSSDDTHLRESHFDTPKELVLYNIEAHQLSRMYLHDTLSLEISIRTYLRASARCRGRREAYLPQLRSLRLVDDSEGMDGILSDSSDLLSAVLREHPHLSELTLFTKFPLLLEYCDDTIAVHLQSLALRRLHLENVTLSQDDTTDEWEAPIVGELIRALPNLVMLDVRFDFQVENYAIALLESPSASARRTMQRLLKGSRLRHFGSNLCIVSFEHLVDESDDEDELSFSTPPDEILRFFPSLPRLLQGLRICDECAPDADLDHILDVCSDDCAAWVRRVASIMLRTTGRYLRTGCPSLRTIALMVAQAPPLMDDTTEENGDDDDQQTWEELLGPPRRRAAAQIALIEDDKVRAIDEWFSWPFSPEVLREYLDLGG